MVMNGETVATGAHLPHEGAQPEVLQSGAGFYVGYLYLGMPYTRESGYYPTREDATQALVDGDYTR